jgi:hypothetical protein
MLTIATKQQIQEYRELDFLNQSKLKKLIVGPHTFDAVEDSNKPHFIVGSAVDCLLLGTQEEFNETYYVSKSEVKPTEAVLKVLNIVYEMVVEDYQEYLTTQLKTEAFYVETDTSIVITQDSIEQEKTSTLVEFGGNYAEREIYILNASEMTEYNPKWGDAAKLKNLATPAACEYFKDLLSCYGRTVIDATTFERIQSIVQSLKTHHRTQHFFDKESFETNDSLEVFYQLPLAFKYLTEDGFTINCKALLDMVVVVKDRQGVIQAVTGIDLKTMDGNTLYFPSSVRQRRYDIQAVWYNLALMQAFNIVDPGVLKPFIFVVESSNFPGSPLVFECTEELLATGKSGRQEVCFVVSDLLFDGVKNIQSSVQLQREVLGVAQLMNLHLYYNQNGYSEDKIIQEAKSKPLKLDWDKVYN